MYNMWTETFPREGDTVKVDFREEGPKVGVVISFFSEFIIIDFGNCRRYIDRLSTIHVKK
jgi:hypothetical protein